MAILLVQAGRSECALSSEHNVQLLHNVLLTDRGLLRTKPPQAPFYLLNALLSFPPYSLQYLSDSIRDQVLTFKDHAPSEQDKLHQNNFPLIRQSYELSMELSREYTTAATATQQLAALEATLEKCRNLWGLRSSIALALIDCVSQRRIKASAAQFDFFAEKLTTTQRLRGAKARRGEAGWWTNSLERAVNGPSSLRLLIIECLLLLCPVGTLEHCESPLSKILDSMREEEWTTLVKIVSALHGPMRRPANKDEALVQSNLKLESMRFAYLIASRDADAFGSVVFLRFFRTYAGVSSEYLRFRQVRAIECAIAGKIEWAEALAIVKDSYARGVYSTELDYAFRNSSLPQEVYSEVLAHSQLYPVSLSDAADAAASRAARKAVRPVSAVAKSEHWFAFDQ